MADTAAVHGMVASGAGVSVAELLARVNATPASRPRPAGARQLRLGAAGRAASVAALVRREAGTLRGPSLPRARPTARILLGDPARRSAGLTAAGVLLSATMASSAPLIGPILLPSDGTREDMPGNVAQLPEPPPAAVGQMPPPQPSEAVFSDTPTAGAGGGFSDPPAGTATDTLRAPSGPTEVGAPPPAGRSGPSAAGDDAPPVGDSGSGTGGGGDPGGQAPPPAGPPDGGDGQQEPPTEPDDSSDGDHGHGGSGEHHAPDRPDDHGSGSDETGSGNADSGEDAPNSGQVDSGAEDDGSDDSSDQQESGQSQDQPSDDAVNQQHQAESGGKHRAGDPPGGESANPDSAQGRHHAHTRPDSQQAS